MSSTAGKDAFLISDSDFFYLIWSRPEHELWSTDLKVWQVHLSCSGKGTVWKSKEITIKTKVMVYQVLVIKYRQEWGHRISTSSSPLGWRASKKKKGKGTVKGKRGFVLVPRREHTSKALRYGTRSQRISQFYLHIPRSSANGMNHTCLCLPSRSCNVVEVPRAVCKVSRSRPFGI